MHKEVGWLLKEKYQGKATKQFKKDVARLDAGEPLDYVIGFTEFLGCKIDLSKKPLIPRPETEFWVGQALREVKGGTVLDIFAGSGCIGLAIMRHVPGVRATFADMSGGAILQIRKNIRLNGAWGATVVQGDVFENIHGTFDCIFANPPYIPTVRKGKVQKSVLRYEPNGALFAGKDGLAAIKKFLKEAKQRLNPGGKIFMEFDSPQKPAIARLLKQYGYEGWEFHKDQHHKWRWIGIDG